MPENKKFFKGLNGFKKVKNWFRFGKKPCEKVDETPNGPEKTEKQPTENRTAKLDRETIVKEIRKLLKSYRDSYKRDRRNVKKFIYQVHVYSCDSGTVVLVVFWYVNNKLSGLVRFRLICLSLFYWFIPLNLYKSAIRLLSHNIFASQ